MQKRVKHSTVYLQKFKRLASLAHCTLRVDNAKSRLANQAHSFLESGMRHEWCWQAWKHSNVQLFLFLPRDQAACRKKIGVANTLAVRRPLSCQTTKAPENATVSSRFSEALWNTLNCLPVISRLLPSKYLATVKPWWSKLPSSVESIKCESQRIKTIQTGGNLQSVKHELILLGVGLIPLKSDAIWMQILYTNTRYMQANSKNWTKTKWHAFKDSQMTTHTPPPLL